MDGMELKKALEKIIRASQGNMDHLSGEARNFARMFNLLAGDVDFLYEALGIDRDSGQADDPEPSSTITLPPGDHTHPVADLPPAVTRVVPSFPVHGTDGFSIPGKRGKQGKRGKPGVPGFTPQPEPALFGIPGTGGGGTGSGEEAYTVGSDLYMARTLI